MKKSLSLAVLLSALSTVAFAQISVTDGSAYTQNFNTLALSTSSIVLNVPWTQNTTLPGWYLYTTSLSSTGVPSYSAHTGIVNLPNTFYSYGSLSSTDRALGALIPAGNTFYDITTGGVNTPAGYVALALTNSTGAALTGFSLSYAGEQWRLQNGSHSYNVPVEYGIGDTFAAVTTWTVPGAVTTFTAPFTTTGAVSLDGNASPNQVTGLGGTVNFDWQSGQTLWIRWDFNRIQGASQGVAIDDVVVTPQGAATPVPEPAVSAIALGSLALGLVLYRRKAARIQAQA